MRDQDKTREQLLRELQEARLKIGELEDLEIERMAALELVENIVKNPATAGYWNLDLRTERLYIRQHDGTPPSFCGSDAECNCHIHPEDLKKLKEDLGNHEKDIFHHFTHRLVTPDGSIRTLAVSASLWQSAEEKTLSGAFMDYSPVQELMQNLDIPWDLRSAFAFGCESNLHHQMILLYAWGRLRNSIEKVVFPLLENCNVSEVLKQHSMDTYFQSFVLIKYLIAAHVSTREQIALNRAVNIIERTAGHFGVRPVFIKDSSFKYLAVNDATCRFFELPKSEILGRTDRDLLGEESEATFEEDQVNSGGRRLLTQKKTKRTAAGSVPFSYVITTVDTLADLQDTVYYWGIICSDDKIESSPRLEEEATAYLSLSMRETMVRALKAAREDCTVLLTGETGAGKDHLAKYIHDHSHRASAAYFSINLGGLSEQLADSELFGHERGAFTGAHKRKRGLLELAEEGTLFLNEIGELSLPLQTKLLAFLDTRQFVRLGGEKAIKVNARLIVATNVDLEKHVEEGRFRKDLFYRINVMPIRVPSLRERPEDIPALTRDILDMLKEERGLVHSQQVTPGEMLKLRRYHWPGGVRELRNVLERSSILARGAALEIVLPDVAAREPKHALTNLELEKDAPAGRAPRKLGKPNQEQLRRIYKECLVEKDYTRADLAKAFGRKPTTVSKWFRSLGFDPGERGRPSGGRDLETLRSIIEEIMR